MERLRLPGLAECPVAARVGLARVAATLAHAGAVQHVAGLFLQVVEHVVDVQHAQAAHQAGGDRRLLLYAEEGVARLKCCHFTKYIPSAEPQKKATEQKIKTTGSI